MKEGCIFVGVKDSEKMRKHVEEEKVRERECESMEICGV